MALNLKSITELLARTRERFNATLDHHEGIGEILKTVLKTERESFTFKLRDTILLVKAHPVLKNELLLKKAEILKAIALRYGDKLVTDLR